MRGSLRYRAGAWRLQVYAGRDPVTGRDRRLTRTVNAPDTKAGRKVAERALAELVLEAEARQPLRHADAVTFAALLERWISHREPEWSPKTTLEARRAARTWLAPLGPVPLWRLRGADLDDLYRDLSERLAPGTIRRAHAIAHAALAQAVRWQLLAANPADAATPPRHRRPELDPPNPLEVARALRGLEHRPGTAALIRLAATTGARRGQLVALRWSDVDLDAGTVTYRAAWTRGADGWTLKDTKTGRTYTVALDPGTIAALERLRRHAAEVALAAGVPLAPDGFIFTDDPAGRTAWRPDSVSQAWRRLRDDAGLERARFHDLRHAVATQLLAAGVDVRTVAGRLGHARPSVTLDVYAHAIPATDRAAADLLGDALDA